MGNAPCVALLVAAAALIGCRDEELPAEPAPEGGGEAEASIAMDLADLGPALGRIVGLLDGGISDTDADDLAQAARDLDNSDWLEAEFDVRYRGGPAKLRVRIVKEDFDAVDLYCFAAGDLAAAIQGEMNSLADGE